MSDSQFNHLSSLYEEAEEHPPRCEKCDSHMKHARGTFEWTCPQCNFEIPEEYQAI